MACSRMIRWFSFVLLLALPVSSAVAETIELVTYYPASANSGDIVGDTLTLRPFTKGPMSWAVVGGEFINPADKATVAAMVAAGVLFEVQGVSGAASSAVFMPGAGAGSDIRVGIGTANPTYRLQVEGNGDQAVEVRAGADGNGGDASLRLHDFGSEIMRLRGVRGSGLAIEDVSTGLVPPVVTIATFLKNGNVGIGTTTPGARLNIAGDTGATDATWTNASLWLTNTNAARPRTFSLSTRADPGGIRKPSFVIADETAGRIRFLINDVGNVGIGLTNPLYRLDVNGAAQFSGDRIFFPYNGGAADLFWIMSGGSTERTHNALGFNASYGANGKVIWARWPLYVTDEGIQGVSEPFSFSDLLLNPKGHNVGIGITSSPVAKLEVNGAIRLDPISTPAGPSAGTIFFNTADKRFYGFNGTVWRRLDN